REVTALEVDVDAVERVDRRLALAVGLAQRAGPHRGRAGGGRVGGSVHGGVHVVSWGVVVGRAARPTCGRGRAPGSWTTLRSGGGPPRPATVGSCARGGSSRGRRRVPRRADGAPPRADARTAPLPRADARTAPLPRADTRTPRGSR